MRKLIAATLMTAVGLLGIACSQTAPPAARKTAAQTAAQGSLFDYREVMVPMRDGVRLQTVIMRTHGFAAPLPILLVRTPYGVPEKAFDKMPPAMKELAVDGYIFVIQNLRGRFKSEGTFTLSEDARIGHGKGTIETRDAWDTIDWLVRNVPNNNGRVGIMGVSYSGYTAAATLLDPHPALKAVSEQAAGPVDEWLHDDDHRYGALRLSYDFEYAVMEESDKLANSNFAFDQWDTYQWYLDLGPLSNINDHYVHGKVPNWNDTVAHPDYDAYWKSLVWVDALHRSSVPNLNVAGFWDQEDPWGPWEIFRRAAENDPDNTNLMVAGPWCHGCWLRPAEDKLGPWPLGHETAREFREAILAPFFAYWLHGKGKKPDWRAKIFQTGSNTWRTYPEWPLKNTVPTELYLHVDGTLSFEVPGVAESDAHRTYVSDPANPVPYRPRPISPTYPGGDWKRWESGDQRFVDHRPDVLTYVSQPLDHDLTVTGEVAAVLYASTNADSEGPDPGAYGQKLNGYQLPIAMEVRRGRYLDSYEHPRALRPNVPARWQIPLRARDHVFLKGHRIMVQIQSTWFPLIDRNPQTFTASIYTAKASDYRPATQRVYSSPKMPSHITLPVVPPTP
jgi:putative CocE/NonD family hydrolase